MITERGLSYLSVVVMVRRLDVFLYQVGLHWNEEVTSCTVRSFNLPHKVLHTKIYTQSCIHLLAITDIWFLTDLLLLLLLTPGKVLLSVHLADGSTVVFQLTNPLLCSFELVLQILLNSGIISLQISPLFSWTKITKTTKLYMHYPFILPIIPHIFNIGYN